MGPLKGGRNKSPSHNVLAAENWLILLLSITLLVHFLFTAYCITGAACLVSLPVNLFHLKE